MTPAPKTIVEITLDAESARFLQGRGDADAPFTSARSRFREHFKPWIAGEIRKTPSVRLLRAVGSLVHGLLKLARQPGNP